MILTMTPKKSSTSARQQPANIHDVAERAGVAISSISRVLSGHPDVSDRMRAKVEAAAAELGY
jgi:LacI family transcriptional regulator